MALIPHRNQLHTQRLVFQLIQTYVEWHAIFPNHSFHLFYSHAIIANQFTYQCRHWLWLFFNHKRNARTQLQNSNKSKIRSVVDNLFIQRQMTFAKKLPWSTHASIHIALVQYTVNQLGELCAKLEWRAVAYWRRVRSMSGRCHAFVRRWFLFSSKIREQLTGFTGIQ